MLKGKLHYLYLPVIGILMLGVLGCEDLLEDALDIEVDLNEPLFNGTYEESVTQVNVASNLIVHNAGGKVMKVSGFGSADFTVEDTRKLLYSLDFGDVTIDGNIYNASSAVETIAFYFSAVSGLSDPVADGAAMIFSADLAPGDNVIAESLADGLDGLNESDTAVISNLKDFFIANQGQGTYTVYAVIADGAEGVTVNSFVLDIGAVFIQTESFTSDSLDKYSTENAQLDEGYIEGAVTNNGTEAATFKIYLGETGGEYPPANQLVASKEGVASGATFTMSSENKSEYMVNTAYLDEQLTQLSNGTTASLEVNLYIYSGADVNVTLSSSVRGTLTVGN